MTIDKLDLLSKGWTTKEIAHASQILEEAQDNKSESIKFGDKLLIIILGFLMIANGFVCSILLIPFIYTIKGNFIIVLSSLVGVIFSALFSIIIYDMERIHRKSENNLFIAYIVNGVVNFYFIVEFATRFGSRTGFPLEQNIYGVAGSYLVAFLVPQLIYQISKKKIIDTKK